MRISFEALNMSPRIDKPAHSNTLTSQCLFLCSEHSLSLAMRFGKAANLEAIIFLFALAPSLEKLVMNRSSSFSNAECASSRLAVCFVSKRALYSAPAPVTPPQRY